MKDIKFRCWDSYEKVMRDVVHPFVGDFEPELTRYEKDGKYFIPMGEVFEWDEIYCLMQYTGLRDKNGKEIYDGDIVKFYNVWGSNSSGNIDEICQIIFEEGQFIPKGFCHGSVHAWVAWSKEVIGNIYETPNLMSGRHEA